MSGFEDLAKWMEGFKSELNESSYQIIFTRLTGNHFKNNDKNFDDPSANVQSKCGSTEGKGNKEKKRHRRRKKKRR